MMQKPWFKGFIWFMATFFFFLASGVIISIFRPGPTENEVMRFMMGMMSAMSSSLMGIAMGIESDSSLRSIIAFSTSAAVPIFLLSAVLGFGIRASQRRDKHVR